MKNILFGALALLAVSSAYGASAPLPCGGDTRIRCVKYDPHEVYPIVATYGYSVTILFAPGELITDMGGGDTEAWTIGTLEGKDGFFIKPKSLKPATDFEVVTMKDGVRKDYTFDLNVKEFKRAEDRVHKVRFVYPEDDAKKKAVVSEKVDTEKMLTDAAKKKPKNEDYWFDGADGLTPKIAWDDGQFTYFRFAPNTDIPAIYFVADDGSENKVNRHMGEANTVVVEMIAKKFMFRRDQLVTAIYNESYDKYGVENNSRTASPAVTRITVAPAESNGSSMAGPRVVPAPAQVQAVNPDVNAMVLEVLRANDQSKSNAGGTNSIDISRPGQRFPAVVTEPGK